MKAQFNSFCQKVDDSMFYEYQRKLSEKMLFKKTKINPGYVGL